MAIGLNSYKSIRNNKDDAFWHWRRIVSIVVLTAFSSSIFSPVFASYDYSDEKLSKTTSDSFANRKGNGNNRIRNNSSESISESVKYKVVKNNEHTNFLLKSDRSKSSVFLPFLSRDNKYQAYLEIGGVKYFNQRSTVAGVYDLFIPLLQTNNKLVFTDLRVFDRSGGSFEGNAHLGFRTIDLDKNRMFGIYGSFDRKRTECGNWFNQVMVGAEYWQDRWFIGGNFYKPIGDTEKFAKKSNKDLKPIGRSIARATITKYYEKSQSGFDAELGYAFTDSFTGYVGGYHFHEKDTKTTAGPKLRLTYDYRKSHGRMLGVLDGIGMELGVQHDEPRGATAYIGIKLKVGLTSSDQNSNLSGFERHMIELVRRDPDIIVEKANTPKKETRYEYYQSGENGFQGGNGPESDDKKCKGMECWNDEDLLSELGLSKNATPKEIETKYKIFYKRYKRLSKIYHPDRGGSNERQAENNASYERKRDAYNELKERGFVDIQSNAQCKAPQNDVKPELPPSPPPSSSSSPPDDTVDIEPQVESPQEQTVEQDFTGYANQTLVGKSYELSPFTLNSVTSNTTFNVAQKISIEPSSGFLTKALENVCSAFRWLDYKLDQVLDEWSPLPKVYALEVGVPESQSDLKAIDQKEQSDQWHIADEEEEEIEITSEDDSQLSKVKCSDPNDLNYLLKKHIVKLGDDVSYTEELKTMLKTTFFSNPYRLSELTDDSIDYLWRMVRKESIDGRAVYYDNKLLDHVIWILTKYIVSFAKKPSHVFSLKNLIENEDENVAKKIITKLSGHIRKSGKETWLDRHEVLDRITLLLPYDARHVLAKIFIERISKAYYETGYAILDVDMLSYIEDLFDLSTTEQEKTLKIISDSLQSILSSSSSSGSILDHEAIKKVETHVRWLLDRSRKPSANLMIAMVEFHRNNPSYFAEEVLRLTRYRIDLPKEILGNFIQFLYIEGIEKNTKRVANEETLQNLAIDLYYRLFENSSQEIENSYEIRKIPQVIKRYLADAFIAILPQVGLNQYVKVKEILGKLPFTHEQFKKLALQEKAVFWHRSGDIQEKLSISKELLKKVDKGTAAILTPFFKSHLASQNKEFLEIAKSAFDELGKYQELIWMEKDKNILFLSGNTSGLLSWFKKNILRWFHEFKVGEVSFLLIPEQWKRLQEKFESKLWLKRYLDRIRFTDINEINQFLLFVEKNNLREEEIAKAFDRYAWIDIDIFYQNLFNNLVYDVRSGIKPKVWQDETRQKASFGASSYYMVSELNWPIEPMIGFLKKIKTKTEDIFGDGRTRKKRRNAQDQVTDSLTVLETLVDYNISPEVVNRGLISASEILDNRVIPNLLKEVNSLVRDAYSFVIKDVDSLLSELLELNPNSELVKELVKEFPQLLKRTKEISQDWLGSKYAISDVTKQLPDWKKEDFISWRKNLNNIDDNNVAEVMAVLSQAAHRTIFKKVFYPRDVQILSLFSLLKSPTGGLDQISTGEGKTVIIAMFAAAKVLEGRKVDVITSSSVLAKRDAKEYKEFYELLGISVGNNIDFEGEGTARDCYLKDVVYGDILSFNGDSLRDITDNVKHGRGFDILIVDEVDNMFIDKNNMKVQLSKSIPGFENLGQLLVYIWGVSKTARSMLHPENGACYLKERISEGTEEWQNGQVELERQKQLEENGQPEEEEQALPIKYAKIEDDLYQFTRIEADCFEIMDEHVANYTRSQLFGYGRKAGDESWFEVPASKKKFAENQLDNWLKSIHISQDYYKKGVQYIIGKNQRGGGKAKEIIPVDVQSGEIQQNLRWSDGLHQFLQINHSLMLYPESVVSIFMSYFGFFNKYKGRIYGVTGTLGAKEHREFLSDGYDVDTITIPTFAYRDLIEFEPIIVKSEDSWMREIVDDLRRTVLNRNRVCLVITPALKYWNHIDAY